MDHSHGDAGSSFTAEASISSTGNPLLLPSSMSQTRKRRESGEYSHSPQSPAKQIRIEEGQMMAETIESFVLDSDSLLPRPEWLHVRSESDSRLSFIQLGELPSNASPIAQFTFAPDENSALHHCIRNGHLSAARKLVLAGASVDVQNSKGVTPFILAAQRGSLSMAKLLEKHGANESHVSFSGSTAALQAAHFGHLAVLKYLIRKNRNLLEKANHHQTTPLMRASQEGHLDVVRYLCGVGAMVNRKNFQSMTSLMLAAQRGHTAICIHLIQHGADLNAMTEQASTSLVLACKRHHLHTVKVLVQAGAELFVKDSRGRTARDIVLHRHNSSSQQRNTGKSLTETIKLVSLLDPISQVDLMRLQARKDRSYEWIKIWSLLQQDRARLRAVEETPFHESIHTFQRLTSFSPSTMAWLRALTLPAPLFCLITQFAPLPNLFDRRVALLIPRCNADANAALISCFDLLDELLEEKGFLRAFDQALIPPPDECHGWVEWKAACVQRAQTGVSSTEGLSKITLDPIPRPRATLAQIDRPEDPTSLVQHRRYAGYLQIISRNFDSLAPILTHPPFDLRLNLVQELSNINDICSVVRRFGAHSGCGGFNACIAADIVMFTSRLCGWSEEN